MHEFSIAVNLIEIAVEYAQKADAKKITQIEIELGELSGIIQDSLEFCFEAACKDTIAENSILSIKIILAISECLDCNKKFETGSLLSVCPNCDSIKCRTVQGKELKIKSITVD